MPISELVTFIHIIGVAFGFGGAMVSDAMFFSSIKDKKFTYSELRFMKIGGMLVWLGIGILLVSGIGLVMLKHELLQSAKFLIKMVVVGVIVLNGIVFHTYHIPKIKEHINKSTKTTKYFQEKGHLLTMSGGVSVVSWFCAALLGSLPALLFTFGQLLLVYVVLLVGALIGGYVLKKVVID